MGEKSKKDKKKSKTEDEAKKKKRKSKKDEEAVKSDDKKKEKKDKKKDKKEEKKEKKEDKEKKEKSDDKKKDKKDKKKKGTKDKKSKKEKSDKEDKKKSKKDKKKDKKEDKKSKSKRKSKGVVIETVCCICKDESADSSAGGLCNHVFCLPCLENLLHRPMKDPQVHDNHLGAPTMGRCPECETELRKFEIKDTKSGKLKYKRNADIHGTPLNRQIYRPKDKTLQLGNFHFNDEKPYIDFKAGIEQDKDMWIMNDGNQVPKKKYFEDGCFFDESTRTFHGQIKWQPITFQGAHQWDVVLAFNKNFDAIHVGIIHERKNIIPEKKDKIDDEVLHRYEYPLDGKWKLIWLNAAGGQQTGNITVRNNEFQQGPYLFNLNYSEPDKPRFRWPLDPVFAAANSGVNLKKKPMGPDIGDKVVWETTHPAFREITWERETIGEPPIQRTVHFGLGNNEYTIDNAKANESENSDEDGWEDNESKSSSSGSDSDSRSSASGSGSDSSGSDSGSDCDSDGSDSS